MPKQLDSHNGLPTRIPGHCDWIVHCGDCTQQGKIAHVEEFRDWMRQNAGGRPCFAVSGNHEVLHPFRQREVLEQVTQEERTSLKIDLKTRLGGCATVLYDEHIVVSGLNVIGLQWHGFPSSFSDYASIWPHSATACDILIVHQPPGVEAGAGDSVDLLRFLQKQDVKPMAVFCGHMHNQFGIKQVDDMFIVNCAVQRGNFVPESNVRGGILVTIDVQQRKVVEARILDENHDV